MSNRQVVGVHNKESRRRSVAKPLGQVSPVCRLRPSSNCRIFLYLRTRPQQRLLFKHPFRQTTYKFVHFRDISALGRAQSAKPFALDGSLLPPGQFQPASLPCLHFRIASLTVGQPFAQDVARIPEAVLTAHLVPKAPIRIVAENSSATLG